MSYLYAPHPTFASPTAAGPASTAPHAYPAGPPAQATMPTVANQAVLRVEGVAQAFISLNIDLHDRLRAAREAFGISTPPEAAKDGGQCPSEGPLLDRVRQLEMIAQSMAVTVSGFRDLFG